MVSNYESLLTKIYERIRDHDFNVAVFWYKNQSYMAFKYSYILVYISRSRKIYYLQQAKDFRRICYWKAILNEQFAGMNISCNVGLS